MLKKQIDAAKRLAHRLNLREKCKLIAVVLGKEVEPPDGEDYSFKTWQFVDPQTDLAIWYSNRAFDDILVHDERDKLLFAYSDCAPDGRIQAFVQGQWLGRLEELYEQAQAELKRLEHAAIQELERQQREAFGLPPLTKVRKELPVGDMADWSTAQVPETVLDVADEPVAKPPVVHDTKISWVTYREKEYTEKAVQRLLEEGVDTRDMSLAEIKEAVEAKRYGFPWHEMAEGDAVTLHPDPNGSWSKNEHNDPDALAVVHVKTGTWIGFIPAYNGDARFVSELMREGRKLTDAKITAVTGGHTKKNGERANRGFTVQVRLE